jgi:branched-chain amino acid transport system substrate-binding protein
MKGLQYHKIARPPSRSGRRGDPEGGGHSGHFGLSAVRQRGTVASWRSQIRSGSFLARALWTTLALVLVAGASIGGLSCRSSPRTIPVGVYLPLTGPQAGFGASIKNGVEMAIQEVNSTGGVKGKTLDATILDDGGDPDRARDQVQRLIEEVRVSVILGGALSGTSLAAAPLCQGQGVPMVSPSSTNPSVTEAGEFITRVCYVDSFQGTAMATFAYTSLRLKKVAIMSKKGDGYSEGLADYFARTFESLGGKVVAEADFTEDSGILAGRLGTLSAANPEAVFLPLYYQDAAVVALKMSERRISTLLLGGDGWDSPELLQLAGDALEGGYFTTHYSPEDRRAKVRGFVRSYRERFDATPDALAALGYDTTQLVAEALARLSEEHPGAFESLAWGGDGPGGEAALADGRRILRDIISETTGFDGVTGEVTIDQSRNAIKPATVLRIKGGAFLHAGMVRP